MNIYIACGLTHVPRNLFKSYTSFIHELAKALSVNGDNNVKYALVNSDPQLAEKPLEKRAGLCYQWDRRMLENSDIIVAEASFPSTGLGIEMQIAQSKNIPIILCFSDYGENKADPVTYENPDHKKHSLQIGDGYISLMALGLPTVSQVLRYRDYKNGIKKILDAINNKYKNRINKKNNKKVIKKAKKKKANN